MNIPASLMYTRSHEWVQEAEDGTLTVGLTDFAQKELGDLVFLNLPEVGDSLEKEQPLGDVESVKAVSDVYSPATGSVADINTALLDAPERINAEPYEAWLVRIADVTDVEELLNSEEYAALCGEGA